MLVFQCVGKIPNKLRGRVKNQHCPTHRVCTGQHVIGCHCQHYGSTGLEPEATWTFVQQYKRRAQHQLQQTDNRAAWIFSINIYIYILVYVKNLGQSQTVPTCSNQLDTCVKKWLRQRRTPWWMESTVMQELSSSGSGWAGEPWGQLDQWSTLWWTNIAMENHHF